MSLHSLNLGDDSLCTLSLRNSNPSKTASLEYLYHYETLVCRLSQDVESLRSDVDDITKRNNEKDRGKAFETSYFRMIFIMIITYFTLFGYFTFLGIDKAFLNAVAPALGFSLSTWSLPYIKEFWICMKESQGVHCKHKITETGSYGSAISKNGLDNNVSVDVVSVDNV